MNNVSIIKKIKDIMAEVFEMPVDQINEDSFINNIESWDSQNHVNLIIKLEEEFDIQLDHNHTIQMINFKSIFDIIEKLIK